MEIKVHINEIEAKRRGFKIRCNENGKPKEAFRKEYKEELALLASIRRETTKPIYFHLTVPVEAPLNTVKNL